MISEMFEHVKEAKEISEEHCSRLGISSLSRSFSFVLKFVKNLKKCIRNNKMK